MNPFKKVFSQNLLFRNNNLVSFLVQGLNFHLNRNIELFYSFNFFKANWFIDLFYYFFLLFFYETDHSEHLHLKFYSLPKIYVSILNDITVIPISECFCLCSKLQIFYEANVVNIYVWNATTVWNFCFLCLRIRSKS